MTTAGNELIKLPKNTLHLWIGVPAPGNSSIDESAEATLSEDERQRWKRLVRSEDRDLFAWSHVALRRVLSHYASVDPSEWSFNSGEHGRPEISNDHGVDGLRFNLSHSAGLVAIVVNRVFDAGVDAANVGRVVDINVVAKTSFSRAERKILDRLPADERRAMFAKIWALKEAFLKATGLGGNVSLADCSFDPTDPARIHFECSDRLAQDPSAWSFALGQEIGDHMVAIACEPASRLQPPSLSRFDLNDVV